MRRSFTTGARATFLYGKLRTARRNAARDFRSYATCAALVYVMPSLSHGRLSAYHRANRGRCLRYLLGRARFWMNSGDTNCQITRARRRAVRYLARAVRRRRRTRRLGSRLGTIPRSNTLTALSFLARPVRLFRLTLSSALALCSKKTMRRETLRSERAAPVSPFGRRARSRQSAR